MHFPHIIMFSLASLDPLIASMSLLKHPFYRKWSKGELTLDDLRCYAKEYFSLVEHIPGIVARVCVRAEGRIPTSDITKIERNVAEEQEHVALWKRFAGSLGISAEELAAHEASEGVQTAVRGLEKLAESSFEAGVIALYALERELPAIAQTKKEGLLRFYGLTTADAHAYFDEHMKEERHLDVWRAIPLMGEGSSAAEASLRAQNHILDCVCEARGIPLHSC